MDRTPTGLDRPAIDSIAVCPQLAAERMWGRPNDDGGGIEMSDHSATAAELTLRVPQ